MSQPASANNTKSGFRFPPTLALLGIFLLLAAIAARVLPPGEFQRERKTILVEGYSMKDHTVVEGDSLESLITSYRVPANRRDRIVAKETGAPVTNLTPGLVLSIPAGNTSSRTVVVPGSYESIDRENDDTAWELTTGVVADIFQAPLKGFQDKASIIAFILILGGAFGIILSTGAIDAFLRWMVATVSKARADFLIIPVLMFLFSAGGAIFGMSEEVIPFVMITIPLALRLGYDTLTGLCISFLAAGLGFAGAFFNPFTLQVAQGIAELQPISGIQFRLATWFLVTGIGIVYVMWWAGRVKRNPTISPTYERDRTLLAKFGAEDQSHKAITRSDILVLLSLAGAILVIIWGVVEKGWYIEELSAGFLIAGVLAAIFSRMDLHKAVDAFAKGAGDLTGAALIVAFSAGIVIIMNDGKVLDTILNAIAGSMEGSGPTFGAIAMFMFQTVLNFFVPSGSGQAAMTMPIMAPLADAMGVSRQVAVLAYQFGDGFGNMIIPTSAVTMSVLGIAEVPWAKWAKWLLPLQAILLAFGCIMLAIAVAIGLT